MLRIKVTLAAMALALTSLIAAPAGTAQAATVTPAAPACVIKKVWLLGWEYKRDCSARDAYNALAMDTVKKLYDRNAGPKAMDRLLASAFGPSVAKYPNGEVASAAALIRDDIKVGYAQGNWSKVSCVRTTLLRALVDRNNLNASLAELSPVLKAIDNRLGKAPLGQVYSAALAQGPKMAKAMGEYANSMNRAGDALTGC